MSAKRRIKLPGRFVDDEHWYIVKFFTDGELSNPVTASQLEDKEEICGDEREPKLHESWHAPWDDGLLWEGEVVFISESKQAAQKYRSEHYKNVKKGKTMTSKRKNTGQPSAAAKKKKESIQQKKENQSLREALANEHANNIFSACMNQNVSPLNSNQNLTNNVPQVPNSFPPNFTFSQSVLHNPILPSFPSTNIAYTSASTSPANHALAAIPTPNLALPPTSTLSANHALPPTSTPYTNHALPPTTTLCTNHAFPPTVPSSPSINGALLTSLSSTPSTNVALTASFPSTPSTNVALPSALPFTPPASVSLTASLPSTPSANVALPPALPSTPSANVALPPALPSTPSANVALIASLPSTPSTNVALLSALPSTPSSNVALPSALPSTPSSNVALTASLPSTPSADVALPLALPSFASANGALPPALPSLPHSSQAPPTIPQLLPTNHVQPATLPCTQPTYQAFSPAILPAPSTYHVPPSALPSSPSTNHALLPTLPCTPSSNHDPPSTLSNSAQHTICPITPGTSNTRSQGFNNFLSMLDSNCGECLLKADRINSLETYVQKLSQDVEFWRAEYNKLKTEKENAPEIVGEAIESDVSKVSLIDDDHYRPRRGIQIEKCKYVFLEQDESMPTGYAYLVSGSQMAVPVIWLEAVKAQFKGKTKPHAAKLVFNGFFQPHEVIKKTGAEILSTPVGKALQLFFLQVLNMEPCAVTRAINTKIHTMTRAINMKRV